MSVTRILYPCFTLIILLLPSFTIGGLPLANQKVLEFVDSVMGTKVGVGECSDLTMNAQYYLKKNQVKSKTKVKKILPGDFISFHRAVFVSDLGVKTSFVEHYAIVYDVITQDEIIIAHQNHN